MRQTRDAMVSRCCDFGLTKEQAEEMTTRYLKLCDDLEEVGGGKYTLDYYIQFTIEWEKACDDVKRG